MRAGKLFHPITIQKATLTDDDYGGSTKSWTTHATARAGIFPVKGVENVVDGKLTMISRFTIIIRFIDGVTTGMRVNGNGRIFEIIAVKNVDERGRQLDLLCKEYA